MEEAIQNHGVLKGLYFGIKRLLRCAPWSLGGYDPVPKKHKQDL
jgi:putative component of membrane protein insertase Oxa1/YidC/SpoIIIJ protein YidD